MTTANEGEWMTDSLSIVPCCKVNRTKNGKMWNEKRMYPYTCQLCKVSQPFRPQQRQFSNLLQENRLNNLCKSPLTQWMLNSHAVDGKNIIIMILYYLSSETDKYLNTTR
jgi:hypothetical protein